MNVSSLPQVLYLYFLHVFPWWFLCSDTVKVFDSNSHKETYWLFWLDLPCRSHMWSQKSTILVLGNHVGRSGSWVEHGNWIDFINKKYYMWCMLHIQYIREPWKYHLHCAWIAKTFIYLFIFHLFVWNIAMMNRNRP